MIDIIKPDHMRICNSCNSEDDVQEIYFTIPYQGVCVALCKVCRKELLKLLTSEEKEDNEKGTKIVNCKYCKYCDSERIDKNMVWCNLHEFARPENYYCADGK